MRSSSPMSFRSNRSIISSTIGVVPSGPVADHEAAIGIAIRGVLLDDTPEKIMRHVEIAACLQHRGLEHERPGMRWLVFQDLIDLGQRVRRPLDILKRIRKGKTQSDRNAFPAPCGKRNRMRVGLDG